MADLSTLKILPMALALIKPEKCHLLAPLVINKCGGRESPVPPITFLSSEQVTVQRADTYAA